MSEKLIRIGRKPELRRKETEPGQPPGDVYVYAPVGYVEESFWEKLQKFQGYKPEDDDVEGQLAAGVGLQGLKTPKLDEILDLNPTGSNVMEFNLQVTLNGTETEEYLREFAVAGEEKKGWVKHTNDLDMEIVAAEKMADEQNKAEDRG